ncbi:MAG: type III-B CRISPR module RAMP protein Cmr4, partial [Acinetobacter sp.]
MESRIFHLQALSALHVGTGQGVGVVDLPIARSKATNLPLVPGSSLKGVLRDEWEKPLGKEKVHTLFGPYHQQEASFAGAIAFGDAHLLILPIRSFAGTVAYATCPFILKQYQRYLQLNALDVLVANNAIVTQATVLKLGNKVALEDLDIDVTDTTNSADGWAEAIAQALYPDSADWQQAFKARFVILPDDTFSFLADTA